MRCIMTRNMPKLNYWSVLAMIVVIGVVRTLPTAYATDVDGVRLRSASESFFKRLKSPFQLSTEEPLATDRPDFTESSSVVGMGRVLLEGGYTYAENEDSSSRTVSHAFPQNLLRIGVTENVELRVVWDAGYLSTSEIDRTTRVVENQQGTTDLLLGTKIQSSRQEGWIPEAALISTFSVPSGSNDFRATASEPRFNLLYGWDLTERINVAGSTGLGFIAEPADRFTLAHQSLTVNYGLTEKLGMYAEWFAFFTHGAEVGAPEHYLDGGLTYKFTPNLQIDWRIGIGLNEHAEDMFTGVGYGIRW
jgi:hypothetical protein